jgi:hypothetical protein
MRGRGSDEHGGVALEVQGWGERLLAKFGHNLIAREFLEGAFTATEFLDSLCDVAFAEAARKISTVHLICAVRQIRGHDTTIVVFNATFR